MSIWLKISVGRKKKNKQPIQDALENDILV